MRKLPLYSILFATLAVFSYAGIRDGRSLPHTITNNVKVGLFTLLGIASAGAPLCILVTQADKSKQAVAELRKVRDLGLITQEEFERRTSLF